MPIIKHFPHETMATMGFLYYAAQKAEIVEYDDAFVTFGFGFNNWKMITEKENKLLK